MNSGPLSDLRYSGGPCRDEQIGQHLEHVVRADLASHHDRQALPRVLVQHRQQLQRPSVGVLEATKSYDQTWPRYSGLSRMHDPSLSHSRPRFGCRSWTFSPSCLQIRSTRLCSPPALDAEHVRDASVAVAAESTREVATISPRSAPSSLATFLARRWSCVAAEHPARAPLRRPELLTYTRHTTSSALGAQKFPSAASSRISLSSVKSATARFRRPFSRSSSFRRRA